MSAEYKKKIPVTSATEINDLNVHHHCAKDQESSFDSNYKSMATNDEHTPQNELLRTKIGGVHNCSGDCSVEKINSLTEGRNLATYEMERK